MFHMSATPNTIKMAKDVLAIQDACNSGGVSNLYHNCVHDLLFQHRDKGGTEWINCNPLVVCLLDKLCSLARSQSFDNPYVSYCFGKVDELSNGLDIQWEVR